jgi:pilus assembly protein CpaE
MARLAGVILSDDDDFRRQVGAQLRASAIAVSVSTDTSVRDHHRSDVIIVDARGDVVRAMADIDRARLASPSAGIFAVAANPAPDLILQAMRAGANEFFTFPPAADALQEALRRTAARRSITSGSDANTLVFFGAKGGAGTTTIAVNCAVEIARLSKSRTIIVDLKPGLGEVSLFLGVRSRYTLLDALENIHRLDAGFIHELVVKHKSGLDILAGSDHFDRPGTIDSSALEEVFRLLAEEYDYILIDAGSQVNAASIPALYTADTIGLVANPDVPSIRNAQRLLERIGQLGASAERVRLILNRAADPYPIPQTQIESAVGHPIDHAFPSDYKTVSTAMNSGVPLALSSNTELAAQFDRFTRRILDGGAEVAVEAPVKKSALGLNRLASIW